VIIAVVVLAAACGSSSKSSSDGSTTTSGKQVAVTAPGVTSSEIRFTAFGTNSNNPTGNCTLECYAQGIKAYFAYQNDQGGIYGRKLVLADEVDDELGKNQQVALNLISKNDSFGLFSYALFSTGWAEIAKTQIPMWVYDLDVPNTNGKMNIFSDVGVICNGCTWFAYPYLAGKAKATKIAALSYGISEASKGCANIIKNSIEKYGSEVGNPKVVYLNNNIVFGMPNGVGPEVTAMKQAGVDMIMTCFDAKGDRAVKQEMVRQGIGSVPMVHPAMYNQEFIQQSGDLLNGDYLLLTHSFRPFEATPNAALTAFKTWMGKTGAKLSEAAMYGWINAGQAYAGLKAAGPSFDRKKVIDALNAIQDYTGGGIIAPLDIGRQHTAPTQDDPATNGPDPQCWVMLKIVAQKLQVLGDKSKPFTCWPGTSRDWVAPTLRDFK
jgi:ABC-type branched-subunit amino acid transport system substrate-binding protein